MKGHEVYATYYSDQQISAERMKLLDALASQTVAAVEADRLERRIERLEAGDTSADVEAWAAQALEAVRDQLRRFKEWPLLSEQWDDIFDPVRMDKISDPILVRGVVWDLWRDFEERPSWRMVMDRLVSSLGITSDRASEAALGTARLPGNGIHAIYPAHLIPRSTNVSDMVHYRWIIEQPYMLGEEIKYRWRELLGDDGMKYRTALALLMEPPFRLVP